MLDRIDYNVERMNTDVKEADKELKVASGYQRRSVKRKVMLLLAILIAGMFILLSLKLSSKGSSKSSPEVIPDVPPAVAPERMRSRRRPSTTMQANRDWHRRKRRIWLGAEDDPLLF
jgi:syntaxin 16